MRNECIVSKKLLYQIAKNVDLQKYVRLNFKLSI